MQISGRIKLRHKHSKGDSKPCPKNVQLNEEVIKGQIKELVRDSVEETLNKLSKDEAGYCAFGAGLNEEEASEPIHLDEVGDIGIFNVMNILAREGHCSVG